jgi:AraC-like DNA-binding protein
MFYKLYTPHPDLETFVNHILIADITIPDDEDAQIVSVPPLPEKCLYFFPFDTPEVHFLSRNLKMDLPQSIILPRLLNRIEFKLKRRNLMVKVGFSPSVLYRILGVSISDFPIDQALDSAVFFDKDIGLVTEQLREAGDYDSMLAIIEAYLMQLKTRLRPELPIDMVFPLLEKNNKVKVVEELAAIAHISIRQLERQCQQRIGMSPKYFLRLSRFGKAWHMKEKDPNLTWTHVAYQTGYFDQMHFIRDFKEFAGVAPSVIEAEFKKNRP